MPTRVWTLERVASLLEEVKRALHGREKRPIEDIIADLQEALTWLHMVTTRFDAVLRAHRKDRADE